MTPCTKQPERYVGLDVHRDYVVVGAVNTQQEVVLAPRRLPLDELLPWAQQHLHVSDAVVLEAMSNAWHVHDQLSPLVGSVTVAHPLLVKMITASRVKTDRHDVLRLARLLAANLIPAVWVPPQEVRHLRRIVAHRRNLVRQRTQLRNRLHGVLQQHDIFPPEGDLFAAERRCWWEALPLPSIERLLVLHNLALLDALTPLIVQVDKEIMQLSTSERWQSSATRLVQLPGIGVTNAMALLSAIGDISRFPGPSNSSATRGWALPSTTRAKCTVADASPSRAEPRCAPHWSRQPGWQSGIAPTGRSVSRRWLGALGEARRS